MRDDWWLPGWQAKGSGPNACPSEYSPPPLSRRTCQAVCTSSSSLTRPARWFRQLYENPIACIGVDSEFHSSKINPLCYRTEMSGVTSTPSNPSALPLLLSRRNNYSVLLSTSG